MNNKTCLIIAVLASAALSAHANLVVNPGFETGTFSGWTQGGNTGSTFVDGMPHSGNYSAWLGPVGSDGTLSQILPTTVGQVYTVDFWLSLDNGTPNDFSASFAGVTILSLVNATAFPYTHYTMNIAATSTSSTLLFTFRDDPAYYHLDDVGVNAVPEPGTVGLIALGALGLAGAVRKRRSV